MRSKSSHISSKSSHQSNSVKISTIILPSCPLPNMIRSYLEIEELLLYIYIGDECCRITPTGFMGIETQNALVKGKNSIIPPIIAFPSEQKISHQSHKRKEVHIIVRVINGPGVAPTYVRNLYPQNFLIWNLSRSRACEREKLLVDVSISVLKCARGFVLFSV